MIRPACLCSCLLLLVGLGVSAPAQDRAAVMPSQQVLKKILELRKAGEVDEALRLLSEQLDLRAEEGTRFGGLYVDVWREAQVRSGRLDPDWAASLYNQLFVSSEKHQHFGGMNDVMGNLLATLGAAGRHGRQTEILEWWAEGQRAAGQRLDASSYPDLGPALPFLPEVRLREIPEEVLYWRAHADPGRPVRKVDLGQKNSQLFKQYADHFGDSGQWVESMEWNFQLLRWASLEDGQPKWQLIQTWFATVESLADWLRWHGFLEEGVAMVDRGLAAPMQESYHGRCNITLSMTRLDLLMDLKRVPEDVIEQAEDLAKRAAANQHLGIGSHRMARVLVARALFHQGRDSDAFGILDELADHGFLPARTTRLGYWIEKGMRERVEGELIALLKTSRESGNKSSEAWLYEQYADFLETSGRLEEALSLRREGIRLYKSFDHFTKIPIELAKLALLLERMGDHEGSRAAVAEARLLLGQGRLPEGRWKLAESLLARAGQETAVAEHKVDKEAKVDFQPERSIVIPIEGAPWTTMLTLTNPTGRAEQGTLSSRGMPLTMAAEGELREIVVRPARAGQAGEDSIDLRLDPQTYELIRISAAAKDTEAGEIALLWTARDGASTVEALVQIAESDAGISSSIIQAGNYRANPFYSVPMHFHYASTDRVIETQPMRFVASQEARVEVYALDGTPLSVDARGNGSLWDRGDELFAGGDGQGNLCMPLEQGAASFLVLVFPIGPLPEEGLSLNVEVRRGDAWVVNSQNRLLP